MRDDRSLTTGEIAKLCDVSFRTVIRWIERGWLRGYKLPGRGDNRVLAADLAAFLGEHRMPVPRALETAGRRVLVVEDPGGVARALKRAGFETRVADGPLEAGALAESFRPGAVALDLDRAGVAAVRFFKARGLGVVAVTRGRGRGTGADAVVRKPARPQEIVTRVARLSEGGMKP